MDCPICHRPLRQEEDTVHDSEWGMMHRKCQDSISSQND